jgi:glutamate formiminotransferase
VTDLLAVPNFSDGRDEHTIESIARALGPNVLDVHTDPDHNRSVFTLSGPPGDLVEKILAAARVAVDQINLTDHKGVHPRVGALDVAPLVYLDEPQRGAACAHALVLGDRLGQELDIPVLLYGELVGGRSRAELRRGGPGQLQRRMQSGELCPDFGPRDLHPTAGVTLVGARPPLVAFNIDLKPPASLQDAQRIAALIRQGGEYGLDGVRAIGLWLADKKIAQVSTNVEDHHATPLAALVRAVAAQAEIAGTELVGLAPGAAFEAFPDEVEVRNKRLLEDALDTLSKRCG